MYRYKLKINIFSNDTFLETEMKKIVPMERFTHEFRTFHAVSIDNLQGCDIIILDSMPENNFADLRRFCKDGALWVLCVNFDQQTALQQEDYRVIDDIWAKPLTADFVAFQWKKLLSLIKLKKDYQLNQNYLDTAINSIPDLIWFKDIGGAHLKVNDAFCHAVGKTQQEVEGRGHYYIWDIEEEEYEEGEFVCLETEEAVIRERKTCLFDEKVKSRYGMRQFKTYKSPLFGDNDEIIGTVGIAHDVTDLENIGTELEIILRSMPFAILLKNNEGSVIDINEKFETYFKTNKNEMLGKNYDSWKMAALHDLSEVNEEGYAESVLYASDEKKILEIHEEPIVDIFGNLVGRLCICRDVTSERALEHQILYNSNTDFLTGLYNRRYFYEYINKNRGQNAISLIYVDLDYFKMVNDTYGHQAGDDALIATAHLLNKCFPDAFIARLGGDEFLITYMGEYSMPFLEKKSLQLLDDMQQTFCASEQLNMLSASIGIAQSNSLNMEIDVLIRQSDLALYEAKQRGRSQYCVYAPALEKSV